MQIVIDDFNQRKSEIEKYFDFLEKIESDYRFLRPIDQSQPPYKIDDDHLKIFRANGFLILYNLVESTVLNCIISIFDDISTKQRDGKKIYYSDVREEIKKFWIKSCYNHDDKIKKDTVTNQFYLLFEKISAGISLQIEKNKIELSGNLNALKIREIAKTLGLSLDQSHYRDHLHGEVLLNIKNHRNALAHGHKSFIEIGKDFTYNGDGQDGTKGLGLKHFKDYAIQHLESFIKDIQQYIQQEKYLKAA